MSRYFAVCLEDYSASPICSGNKTYYGTKGEVADFIKVIYLLVTPSNIKVI